VRSVQEALSALHRRGVPAGVAAAAIARCKAAGILDDRACARLWAGQWARRGYAWAAIRQQLASKGLDEGSIEEAGRSIQWSAGDAARAQAEAAARLGSRPRRAERLRTARALAAKGFDPDLVEQVLESTLGSHPSHAER